MNRRQRTPSQVEHLIRENERLQGKIRAVRTSRLSSNAASILRDAIKYGFTGTAVVLCVKYLAGQTTTVDAALDVCASFKDVIAELAPAWWVQIATLAMWPFMLRANARLRRINSDHVKKLSKITVEREEKLDPDRSSSGLGHDGETHERDKI